MIPPNLSARDRPRSEGYRISGAAKFAQQNVKGNVTSLLIIFAVPGPAHKRRTDNGVAGLQTVAQVAKSIGKVGTRDGYITLCRDASVRCCRNFGRNWRELRETRWRKTSSAVYTMRPSKMPPRGAESSHVGREPPRRSRSTRTMDRERGEDNR